MSQCGSRAGCVSGFHVGLWAGTGFKQMLCPLESRQYGALGKYGTVVLLLSFHYSSYQLCVIQQVPSMAFT